MTAIRSWLTADQPPGQALVITGQPGAGKSAVLARAALSVEAEHGGPGLAFHARAATIGDFLTALADLIGMDTPASIDELVTSLAGLPGQPPTRVVLDALDEAASDRDRRQIDRGSGRAGSAARAAGRRRHPARWPSATPLRRAGCWPP